MIDLTSIVMTAVVTGVGGAITSALSTALVNLGLSAVSREGGEQ